MMLDYALYLDHSGTDDGQPVVAMGGFASTAREWMKLSYEWERMLAGPPSFRRFHTTDLLAGKGEFRGWSWDQRETVLKRAAEIVLRHTMFTVGASVPRTEYDPAIAKVGKRLKGGPVDLCLFVILGDVVDWFSRKNLPDNERIAVVIDRVESGGEETTEAHRGERQSRAGEHAALSGGWHGHVWTFG